MAPKNRQNPGEKGEGARAAQTKKSNGEMAPGTRRPIPTLGKMSGKQSTGTSRNAKSNVPPSSSPGGNKTQPMITGFWKGGAQEDNLVHSMPPQDDMQITLDGKLGADSERKTLPEDVKSTVRQRRRKSKGQAPSGDGVEPSSQTRKALKWDYSGTNLMSTAEVHTFEVQDNAEKRADALVCSLVSNTGARYTDSEMLQSIYDLIKELQTETRAESWRARMAKKHLQGTVHKMVKSWAVIEGKLSSMEERTMVVEADIEALRAQTATPDGQFTYIMWKLEDQENRQRRNNLRFLGIKKEVEGNSNRAYMIKMLQEAFPEVTN
ncbi:hypothetical protein NDU88_005687 [Pleurodeles waltl]|uniref:Uncharacterized protein n=1 Tax=Pleurodeles waltl TaxID=8319 RepID=A0AAV7NQZ5_PLEWA|nr:hypothetical protein NDU88_005687 [Pleurodeles waltl]